MDIYIYICVYIDGYRKYRKYMNIFQSLRDIILISSFNR